MVSLEHTGVLQNSCSYYFGQLTRKYWVKILVFQNILRKFPKIFIIDILQDFCQWICLLLLMFASSSWVAPCCSEMLTSFPKMNLVNISTSFRMNTWIRFLRKGLISEKIYPFYFLCDIGWYRLHKCINQITCLMWWW